MVGPCPASDGEVEGILHLVDVIQRLVVLGAVVAGRDIPSTGQEHSVGEAHPVGDFRPVVRRSRRMDEQGFATGLVHRFEQSGGANLGGIAQG